jgi:hypothetical protein
MHPRFLSVAATLVLALAACERASLTSVADQPGALATSSGGAPDRVDPWRRVSSTELWAYGARTDTSFSVGVKHPGATRGVYRGQWLVDAAGVRGGLEALENQPGVRVLQVDGSSPTIRVKVASPDALNRIRQLPFVDYLEPAVLASTPGATGAPSLNRIASAGPLFSSGSGGDPNYGHYIDAGGNWIPNIFTGMRIPEAWQLSTGAGAIIGLIDTGVDVGQPDLAHWTRRKVYAPDNLDDLKGHGTHMAGVIGARPGRGYVVGVAHGAGHVSIKDSDNYLDVNTWRVTAAMDTAVLYGAKVINMSFRSDNTSNAVSDRIEKYYSGQQPSGVRYDVLFVGAAGSGGNAGSYLYGVVFPASHPDVIAVSAINYDDRQIYTKSHSGYQVELSSYHGQPTTGTNDEGYYNAQSGNSSNASAIVSSVATLVRGRYPFLRNYEVRNRLRRGAEDLGPVGRDSHYGYGIINAYAAVGGFYQSILFGSSWHDQCTATTVPNRTCFFNYAATSCFAETFRVAGYGDGPFTYRWSNGSTSDQTSMYLCPTYSGNESIQVTVTDGLQNRTMTLTVYIRVDGGGMPGCDPNLDPMCPA